MFEKRKEEDAKQEGDLVCGGVGWVDVVGGLCGSGSERGVVNVDSVLDVGVYQDEHDGHAQKLSFGVGIGGERGCVGEG